MKLINHPPGLRHGVAVVTLIDTETAAVALGVTTRRIRQLVAEGRLTNKGTARRILIPLSEILHFR